MKSLILLFFLSPLMLFAQRDFDFTVFTTKAVHIDSRDERPGAKPDTLNLSLFRKFEKSSNVLKEISFLNTGNVIEYEIEFVGASYQTGCPVLMYKVLKVDKQDIGERFVFINPMEPSIIFKSETFFSSYH